MDEKKVELYWDENDVYTIEDIRFWKEYSKKMDMEKYRRPSTHRFKANSVIEQGGRSYLKPEKHVNWGLVCASIMIFIIYICFFTG